MALWICSQFLPPPSFTRNHLVVCSIVLQYGNIGTGARRWKCVTAPMLVKFLGKFFRKNSPPNLAGEWFLLQRLQFRLVSRRQRVTVHVQQTRHELVPSDHAHEIDHTALAEFVHSRLEQSITDVFGVQ